MSERPAFSMREAEREYWRRLDERDSYVGVERREPKQAER
jgi:hypothetical protein